MSIRHGRFQARNLSGTTVVQSGDSNTVRYSASVVVCPRFRRHRDNAPTKSSHAECLCPVSHAELQCISAILLHYEFPLSA